MKKGAIILIVSLLFALLTLLPVSTALAAPPAPVPISPSNGSVVTSTSLILDWNDVVAYPPVNLYLITMSNNVGFTAPISATTTTSYYIFPVPLIPGQRWWWYVQASDNGGLTWGPPSAIWNFYVQAPAIMLSPTQGLPGTVITVYGSGWGLGELIRVYYDGALQQVVEAPSGSWKTTIIASGSPGYHTVTATGSASGTQGTNFIILGSARYVIQSATQGPPGTTLIISGYNFNPGETVYVTFAGFVVTQGIADYTGSFSLVFLIPERPAGNYIIDAYGNLTPATSVTDLVFTVVPVVSISPTTTKVGEQLTITGKSFKPFSAINLGYDGKSSSTTSNIFGGFSTIITAPDKSGEYTLIATDASDYSATVTFTVISPISMLLSSTVGIVGEELTISGNSQSRGTLIITYDGVDIGTCAPEADGSFVFSFKIPKSTARQHTITVTDNLNNSASATLTMESNPPPTPTPKKPKEGSRASWSRTVTFSWEEVSDPSGVVYNLRVEDLASREVLNVSGIITSDYKESLPSEGRFYWFVQAEDGARNVSAWAGPVSFVVGPPMPIWAIVLLGLVAVGVAGFLYYLIKIRQLFPPPKKAKAKKTKTIVVKVQVSGGVKGKESARKITKEITKKLQR